ncbi:MAG: AI-2E family transporter [Planctomycetia bacterium]
MFAPDHEPAAPAPTAARPAAAGSAATAAAVTLAVLALGAAVTVMGPVLQPFLVALFLFHATQFGAKSLARLGMQPWTAYPTLIGLTLIFSILTAQFVYREADVFRRTWPRYEERIAVYLSEWWPSCAAHTRATLAAAPAGDAAADAGASRNASRPAAPEHAPPASRVAKQPAVEPLPEQTADLLAAAAVPAEKPAAGAADGATNAAADATHASAAAAEATAPAPDDDRQPASPPAARPGRATLTELFRITSQDVIDYVFSHGLRVAELFVVVFCYLVFLFVGSRKLEARVLRAFPGERGERLVAIGEGITESMERFMVVKTATGVGMAVSAGMLMYLFGLDHWMLWAFLFFASNYITYIGSMAACVPPIVLAYLDLDQAVMATLLAALIVLNRIFWIDFFELRMSGRQLNLDPTVLFLWLSYWGWAWGILGLILAYPMLAAVRIALEHTGGLRGWALLLSDE